MEIEQAAKLIGIAVEDVFAKMLDTEVAPLGFFWDPNPLLRSEVMVAVCLHGDLRGYLSLHCTENQAREFTRRLLGMPQDDLTAELTTQDTVRDAVSELVNMISGAFRQSLSSEQWIEMALPLFFRGPTFEIHMPEARGIVVHIDAPTGGFQIELAATKAGPERTA